MPLLAAIHTEGLICGGMMGGVIGAGGGTKLKIQDVSQVSPLDTTGGGPWPTSAYWTWRPRPRRVAPSGAKVCQLGTLNVRIEPGVLGKSWTRLCSPSSGPPWRIILT